MNYLGHNEFGLNHKSWNRPNNFKDLNDINYWLEQWCLFYENIFNNYQSNNNCIFIIYEDLTNPNYIKEILNKLNIINVEKLNLNYFSNSNKEKIDFVYDNKIYEKAKNIYKNFRHKFTASN